MESLPRIICLGEILFDCLADQIGVGFEQVQSWTPYPGGALANVAVAVTKLGTPAAFIGCIGVDPPGNDLIQLLETTGVNTQGVQRHSTAPTRQVYVVRSEEGDRSFAGFGNLPPDGFADSFLESSHLPEKLFQNAEFLVLGTLELAYPTTRAAIFRALELAELYHVKVVLDVNWRPMFWPDETEAMGLIKQLWQWVDFVKLAEEEAQWLFKTTDAGAIAHRLDTVEGVIVTGGNADVSYCLNDHEGKVTPFAFQVADSTGAGDAFLAGFLHQLSQKGISSLTDSETAKEIITYACAVGGLTTTKPGAIAAQPTPEEVTAFLQK